MRLARYMLACSVQTERLSASVFRDRHWYLAREGGSAFAILGSFPTCAQGTRRTHLHSAPAWRGTAGAWQVIYPRAALVMLQPRVVEQRAMQSASPSAAAVLPPEQSNQQR